MTGTLDGFDYCAARHRRAVAARLHRPGVLFVSAGRVVPRLGTDRDLPFRVDSNFFYLTGAEIAGAAVIVNISTGRSTLIVPHVSVDDAVWTGTPPSTDQYRDKLNVDAVITDDDLAIDPSQVFGDAKTTVFVPASSDLTLLDRFKITSTSSRIDHVLLDEALAEERLVKDPCEIALMRHANHITCAAHEQAMREAFNFHTERDAEALFRYVVTQRGAHNLAYETIAATAVRAATLHYTNNNHRIGSSTELMLLDAGAEFHAYAADVTRTFPVGGRFTRHARNIYTIVLEAQKAVITRMKPGVPWEDLHRLAVKLIGEGLIALGIITADINTALANFIPQLFMPHGIGHLLGLDVHDVGGYPRGVERIDEPSIRYLRMRRDLKAGMVMTVEPGLYFIPELLDPLRGKAKYDDLIDWRVLDEYKGVGGVRIEDNVLVTPEGYSNLTNAVKEVDDIEHLMHRIAVK